MSFDAVAVGVQIGPEQATDYWRERAECLEKWICELLRKNQALRMNLGKEWSYNSEVKKQPWHLHDPEEGMNKLLSANPTHIVRAAVQPCLDAVDEKLIGGNSGKAILSSIKRASAPFRKIIVAMDDSPEARDALGAGIELCKLIGIPLETITVIEPPPMYTALILAADPKVAQELETDRKRHYYQIIESAVAEGRQHVVEVTGHLVVAEEVDGVISFLRANGADLLVIGLRQHSSNVARLWSTVSSVEQKAPCSVLAVHAMQR